MRWSHTFEPSNNLDVVVCDATDKFDVKVLCEGADVVVSLLGHVKDSPDRVQTEAIQTILKVMNSLKIKRLISLTGTGVRFIGDTPGFVDKFANFAIKLVDPQRIADGIEHAEVLKSSQVDWTLLRVLKLTNSHAPKGRVPMSTTGPAKTLTSREEVAKAIVQLIEDDSYIRQALIIVK